MRKWARHGPAGCLSCALVLRGWMCPGAEPGLQPPNPHAIRRVLHISADGLGAVFLEEYLMREREAFPTLARLHAEGSWTWNARCDCSNSLTVPNHACMLTGRPALQAPRGGPPDAPHGYPYDADPGPPWTLHNFDALALYYRASVFDAVHDRGFRTGFFAAKRKLDFLRRSYDEINGAPDLSGFDDGRDKVDCVGILDWTGFSLLRVNDSNLVSEAVAMLATNPPTYTFLHLADPDITGHYFSWGTPEYRDAVLEVDSQLARMLAAIERDPRLAGSTAILFTADHGGGDASGLHYDPTEPRVFRVPMLIWGPGIPAGADLYSLFANRSDPGPAYTDYDSARQPLWTGDAANVALGLLGLPPVPGSVLIAEFKPRLVLARSPEGLTLAWRATGADYVLEWAVSPIDAAWSRMPEAPRLADGGYTYVLAADPTADPRFYRLRRLPSAEGAPAR